MGFGKLLEKKMNKKGIKQAELAEAVGIPKTTLSSMILRDNTKIEIEKFLQRVENRKCVQNYLFLYENEYIIYLQNEKAFKF